MNHFKKSKNSLMIIAALTSLVFASILFAQINAMADHHSGTSLPIKSIDPVEVCMVNDAIMGKPQIPVQVGKKTYYGCCKGCVSTLQTKRHMRYSNDPVTGKEVDKATAFIMSGLAGKALYFESLETAQKYIASSK